MARLVGRRFGAMILVLLFLVVIVFTLQHLSPTDPVHSFLGANASKAAIKAETHRLGYDRPLVVQYVHYVRDLLRGNLQMSLRTPGGR